MFALEESQIDWGVLRVQKMYLLHLSENRKLTHNEQAAVEGLINLLDYVQDQAITSGAVEGCVVFTHRGLRRMAMNMGLPYEEIDDAPFVIIDEDGNWVDAFATRPDAEKALNYLTTEHSYECLDIITGEEWRVRLHGK